VSGSINNYEVTLINLAPIKGEDKMISVNKDIRKALNRQGGDTVTVSLYLNSVKPELSENQVLEAFCESGVLTVFKNLGKLE
jgi:Domain of unknown function (DUF1905)